MKILIVEDHEPTALALKQVLSHNYIVTIAHDGQTGLELAQSFTYDLLLLDVIVPKIDGITLCRKLRSSGSQSPILLLTALDSNSDRVMGLDAGADDYIVKPFDLDELTARIRALLRRGNSTLPSIITWGDLQFDTNTNEVCYREKILRLTPKECSLLKLFLLNPQRVFSRRVIIERLWSDEDSPGEETITTHVKNLRKKIKAVGVSTGFIEKVYGLGYRLKPLTKLEESESELASKNVEPVASTTEVSVSREQQLKVSLGKLWQKYKSTFTDQVEVLKCANKALKERKLTSELQQQAKQEAHRLAGSLGIFGLEEGSILAQLIEKLLQTEGTIPPMQALEFSSQVERLEQMLTQPPPVISVTSTTLVKTLDLTRILVIDDDLVLTELLKSEAKVWEMEVEVAIDLTAGRSAIAKTAPDLIVLDLNFPDSTQDGVSLLQEQASSGSQIPILVLTNRDLLIDRVEVARLGACGFLQKPISTQQIFTTISNILSRTLNNPIKVMIVDDDARILATLSTLLKPWEIEVITLETPQQFWEVLLAQTPDLLILDLEMPNFNGIELCQVVRNDPYWQDLPILFFTSHTDLDTIDRAFAAGADDYICKSVSKQELISRILNRLKRLSRKQKTQTY